MNNIGTNNTLENYFQPGIAVMDYERIAAYLVEHLKNVNLKRQGKIGTDTVDLEYWSNEEFWSDILDRNRKVLKWAKLAKFQIVDWFPRTPGLYHTKRASMARIEAQHYIRVENGIKFYEPRGKTHMIDGGIGAVRFKTINIENEDCWLCSATSDGYCHSGIPLAIPNYFMNSIDFISNYRITGQIRFLPQFLEYHFYHMSGIPQIYLLVDRIERFGPNAINPIVTPMVFFTSKRNRRDSEQGSVTYVNCRTNSQQELDLAAEWLNNYVSRYDGEIITNFDEQRPIFKDAPFSLQKILNGEFNKKEFMKFHIHEANIICDSIEKIYSEAVDMSKNEINIGDGSIVIGDVVAAKSIRNSFNKVESSNASEHLKTLLKQFNNSVAKMADTLPKEKAQEVSRDLESFVSEVTSDKPRKKWYETTLESIKEVAKTVGELGKPVLEIAKSILPLLS